ncbi:helix-turn-helix transcriptional regulator [Streptomyces sp. NPDC046985]|uniref:helix-turn-helix transcriptional regulator n=1 Tax=Streptomyces sp. NPDC046985 TaxID=3155377 RepID=UPI0033F74241
MPRDRAALGAFLRSRRDRLSPSQVGLKVAPGPRRVPGLRREELAVLAGLSADYYSRLEQGRQANVSTGVLDALARALRLDEVEHAHLRDLADPAARHCGGDPDAAQSPAPGLIRVLRTLDHVPVLLLGHRGRVLARNALLAEVLGRPLEPGSSFIRYMFQDPVARERIANWSHFAAATVGMLRRETARRPYDDRLARLVNELRTADRDVARWWDDHAVVDFRSTSKRIEHPVAGPMLFDIEHVVAPDEPEQHLVIYTADPDSPTARVLPMLASWSGAHRA